MKSSARNEGDFSGPCSVFIQMMNDAPGKLRGGGPCARCIEELAPAVPVFSTDIRILILHVNCMPVTKRLVSFVPFPQRSQRVPILPHTYLHTLILHFYSKAVSETIDSYP